MRLLTWYQCDQFGSIFLMTNIAPKVTQMYGDFWAILKNISFQIKIAVSTFWSTLILTSVVYVIKTFFGVNLDFPKIKTLKKVCSGV